MKDSSTQQRLTSDQRLVGWERKLLDLTMANALVNTIYGNACIPFRENYDQDFLEDLTDRGASFPLLAADQEEKGLHSDWDKDLLKKTAKKLLRTANNNLSELGSSQLFMGVGMLRYIDNPDPLHPNVAPESHCAPVILVPVSIHYQSVVGRYAIKAQSDDILVNSTLVELLHQEHDRDLRHLVPTEGRDLDVEAVFETFGKMAASKEGWSFDGGLCLGIFAFSKFVMWNDLHTHPDRFKETPLIDSLLRQRPVSNTGGQPADASTTDTTMRPDQLVLPIAADSSQMEAVMDAESGRSFLLYGPPGTGKSPRLKYVLRCWMKSWTMWSRQRWRD